MEDKYIPLKDMEEGRWYIVDARNFSQAVWNGSVFIGIREKFGSYFWDEEHHWDEGAPYGTVKPIAVVPRVK